MGGSDLDPKSQIVEAIGQIRENWRNLRESLVLLVMRRNSVQDEVTRLEKLITDLETKAVYAERINNADLAAELRNESRQRQEELGRARSLLAQAEAEAESAKLRLPEEEARLQQLTNDLQAQLARLTAAQVETGAPGGLGSGGEDLWSRATEKIGDLQREASAREEVAATSAGQPSPGSLSTPQTVVPSVDQQTEDLLAQLEAKLGVKGPPAIPQAGESSAETPANFLEFDRASDVSSETAVSSAAESRETLAAPSLEPAQRRSFTAIIKGEVSPMEPTQRVRVAAIGTGNIFRGAHLPAYPDIPQAQLVAFCDPDKEAQKAVLQRYQNLVDAKIKHAKERNDQATVDRLESDLGLVQICDDIREVIETVKPDLVDICTQPFLHTPLAIQALEAGLHVMCEKPISRSWLESQRLIETVQRTGKLYQHNENWLWDKDYYTAKKLVDAGAIGEPVLMFLATAHGGPEGAPKFWNSDFGGGGALLDNGIHAIGAAWYVSGLDKRPTYVKAAQPFGMSIRMPNRILDGRYQTVNVDDDAHILIRFENPDSLAWTTAHVEGSWSHRDSPDTVIIGTTGKILFVSEEDRRYAVVIDSYDRESRRIEVSGPTWQHWPSSFYGEILNMVQCVRNGVPSLSGAEFGAECSAVVGASYLSEKSGRKAVAVDEFKAFARDIASRYPNDPTGADNALVDALLSAVRNR
jgi:predicted dehydrogenase/phage shock protein A